MGNALADWFGAGGSVLAAGVAATVLVIQLIQGRHERVFAQATRLTWWTEPAHSDAEIRRYADAGGPWTDEYGAVDLAMLIILNSSEDCVYEVTVCVAKDALYDGGQGPTSHSVRQIGVLPPGRAQFHVPTPRAHTPTEGQVLATALPFNLLVDSVRFRDRRNVIWRRFGNGRLERQPDAKPVTAAMYAN